MSTNISQYSLPINNIQYDRIAVHERLLECITAAVSSYRFSQPDNVSVYLVGQAQGIIVLPGTLVQKPLEKKS